VVVLVLHLWVVLVAVLKHRVCSRQHIHTHEGADTCKPQAVTFRGSAAAAIVGAAAVGSLRSSPPAQRLRSR
jgi:hypothetical protein